MDKQLVSFIICACESSAHLFVIYQAGPILRQKIILFLIAEGGANIFGVFRVKIHDFMPKNHIFFQF
jgi:hypothetical protein